MSFSGACRETRERDRDTDMPMPKGRKFNEGYVTLRGRESMQFRKIASVMTQRGDRMNHATARGVLLRGMEKVAAAVLTAVTGHAEREQVERLIRSEPFQTYVGDVLDEEGD